MRATTMNWVPRTRSASDSGFFAARSGSEQVSFPILDALRPLHSHQAVSHHVQIGERTGDEQPIRVFRNTAIAHLGEAKDSLDDADGVLDPGTHARARPIDHALTRLEVLVAAPALLSEVFRRGSKSFDHRALPGVSGYTGSMSAHSSPQGTTRSISTRNCARRVIFAYFSNPEPASVICLLFILVPRSCLLSAEALHFRQVNRGLVQRFLRRHHYRAYANCHPSSSCHRALGT